MPVGQMTYDHTEDSPWARGAYLYFIYAVDAAGNYSDSQPSWPRRAVNYVLGDFDGDGVIAARVPDITDFAMAYGCGRGR